MKRLALVMSVAMASPASIALDSRDLIPKKPADLIPVLTGGGLAVACNQALKGRDGRAVAMLVCGSLGVLVGQKIKQALKEQEQIQLAEATNATLSTGKPQTVRTAEGNTITTELVASKTSTEAAAMPSPPNTPTRAEQKAERRAQRQAARPAAPEHPATTPNSAAPAPAASSAAIAVAVKEGECGTVRQTVVTSDNQRFEDTVNACKEGGTWVAN